MAGLEGEVDQAYADMANVRDGIRAEMSSATAAYQYGVAGAWSTDEVLAATDEHLRATGHDPDDMDTDFFVDDAEAGARRSIKPYEDMSEDEQRAYNAWLNSDQVNDLIAYDRTVAGQRMDEVADSLERR